MIALLWTRSSLPASKWIRGLTGEDVSHFAIELDRRIIFQSNFYGAKLLWSDAFEKHSEIVHRIDLLLTGQEEEAIYQRLIHQFADHPYDWGAFAFMAYAMLRHRWFGTPIPTRNLWGSDRAFLCLELAQCLDVIGIQLPELDTVLPGRLYSMVKEQLDGNIPNT